MFDILLERTKCLFFPSLKPLSVTLCHFPQGNPLSVLASVTGPILPSALGMADPTSAPRDQAGRQVQEDALLKAAKWSHLIHAPPVNLQGPLVISRPSRRELGARP